MKCQMCGSSTKASDTGMDHKKFPHLPPNFFSIPFGIAGLADVWKAAVVPLGTPWAVVNTIDIISAVLWLLILVVYLAKGPRLVLADFRDRIVAPFIALIVITPMLYGAELDAYAPIAGKTIVVTFFILTVLYGGWLAGQWMVEDLDNDALHPGYFLPTVAGPFIATFSLVDVHLHALAELSFGVGMLSWVMLGAFMLNRLFFRPMLVPGLIPTIAIEAAPAAVGGLAYNALSGGATNTFAYAIAGYGILMILVQLRLIPLYARLKFSPGFWAFTFSYTAVGSDAVVWITHKHPAGGTAYVGVLLALTSALILAIGVRSIVALKRHQFIPHPAPLPAPDTAKEPA